MGDWDPERHTAAGVVDLTPAELARCRVRLAELPGFDPVGLWLTELNGQHEHIVLHADERDVFVHSGGEDDDPWWWTKDQEHAPGTHPDAEPYVSTIDASTRDRLARWAVDEPEATAPAYTYSYESITDGHPAGFVVWLGADAIGASTEAAAKWFGCAHMPPLGDLNPKDPRLLPDGSRLVDALALAAVAQHLGGQRD